jgi:hypothetical protein
VQVSLCVAVDLLDDAAVIEQLQRLHDRSAFGDVGSRRDAGLRGAVLAAATSLPSGTAGGIASAAAASRNQMRQG